MEYIEYLKNKLSYNILILIYISTVVAGLSVIVYMVLKDNIAGIGSPIEVMLLAMSPIIILITKRLSIYMYYTVKFTLRMEQTYKDYTQSNEYKNIVALGDHIVEVTKDLKQKDKGETTLLGLEMALREKELDYFQIAMLTEYLSTQNVVLRRRDVDELGFMYGEQKYDKIRILM